MRMGAIYPPAKALFVWNTILNISYLFALLLMAKHFYMIGGRSNRVWNISLWVVFLAGLRFYLTNIALGQTDILVLMFFALFMLCYVKDRDILCGIIFALILQFKPFFAPALFYFLFAKRIKITLSAFVSFFCFLSIPGYMLGAAKTIELSREWFDILKFSIPSQVLNPKNKSFVFLIGRLFAVPSHLFYLIGAVLTLSAYISMLWAEKMERKLGKSDFKYLEVSMIIIISLLFSPIAWTAHFLTLTLPVGVAIYFTAQVKEKRPLYFLLGAFFIAACAIGTDLTRGLPYINKIPFSTLPFGTMVLAFAIIYAYRKIAI